MGYSKEKVLLAFSEVSETSKYKEISVLWPAVLCHLREDLIYGVHSEPQTLTEDFQSTSTACTFSNGNKHTILNAIISPVENVEKFLIQGFVNIQVKLILLLRAIKWVPIATVEICQISLLPVPLLVHFP
jgi:hypothetical protein